MRRVGGLAGESVEWVGRGLRAPTGVKVIVVVMVVRGGGGGRVVGVELLTGWIGVLAVGCGCGSLCVRVSSKRLWGTWVGVGVLCKG